jgi:hypothetical protein
MEVKVGIQNSPREIVVETDATAAEIERELSAALATPSGTALLSLSNAKGGRVLIPADKIAFVEFSTDTARRVGFGNIA